MDMGSSRRNIVLPELAQACGLVSVNLTVVVLVATGVLESEVIKDLLN